MRIIIACLTCLLSLSFVLSCSETDSPVRLQEYNESLPPFAEILLPSDYPDDWVTLTDADVDALRNLVIPPHWWNNTNLSEEMKEKYTHATLLKQFGDIPEVRYLIEFGRYSGLGVSNLITRITVDRDLFGRYSGLGVSHKLFVAYFQAHYLLFPNEQNRRALEEARNIENQPIPEPPPPQKVLGDPITVERAEEIRIELREKHGDIPEVHVVVDFFIKVVKKKPITDDEFLAYLEAQHHLEPHNEHIRRQLEKYKKARADGIPFHLVDGEDE